MKGRTLLLLAGAAALALACQDEISAPGVCPEFCAQGNIDVRDTLLPSGVLPVGSFSGYVLSHEAAEVQVVGPAVPGESHPLLVFNPFATLYAGTDTSVQDTVRQTDSLQFTFNIVRRNTSVTGLTIAIHEIPIAVDSTATYAGLAPYFEDSTLITSFQIPDSLVKGTVTATALPTAFRHFGGDSLTSAIGLRITSPDPAFVSLGQPDTVVLARVTRWVQLDSTTGTTRVSRSESRILKFHTFVADSTGLPAPAGLAVGGTAGARTFLKLDVPARLVDSTLIVRATLLMPPLQPPFGAPGDTFRLRVHALGADLGPKSPLLLEESDTATIGSARVAVGSGDTVAVDITNILLAWRSNPTVPHTVMLRAVPEAASVNTFEVGTAAIRITYGLPFRLGGK